MLKEGSYYTPLAGLVCGFRLYRECPPGNFIATTLRKLPNRVKPWTAEEHPRRERPTEVDESNLENPTSWVAVKVWGLGCLILGFGFRGFGGLWFWGFGCVILGFTA